MTSLAVSIIWLLALLAAAAHVQDARRSLASAAAVALAFLVVASLALWLSPQPNWVGVLLGIGASWRLIAGPLPRAGGVLAGASAALAAALQVAGGVSPWLAFPVTVAALAATFAWRAGSAANDNLREVVLVIAALGFPIAGLAGDLAFGWVSASVLNAGAMEPVAPEPPLWALAVVGLAVVAGIVRGIWIKR